MLKSLPVGPEAITYEVRGDGPGLLVPWCNYPWPSMPVVDRLCEHFTVAMVSPRGYQSSSWLADTDRYGTELLTDDLFAVCDHLGLERFAVLGYSLTGAMAAWLAGESDRIRAVIAGGFPLLGSYGRILGDAEPSVASNSVDTGGQFDVAAVLAFYGELASLPCDGLVSRRRCPMLSFFGSEDETVKSLGWTADDALRLATEGVEIVVLPGFDHAFAPLGLVDVSETLINFLHE